MSMPSHKATMAEHVNFQDRVIKIYEKKVTALTKKVQEQADLILWLSNKHEGFYQSSAWLELRIRVLDVYGPICMCCGSYPPEVVIHVDHIKPFSVWPELALEFDNLQVLCENCNRGKSNKVMTDYRPAKKAARANPMDFTALANAQMKRVGA
jgi:hypothetical protein